MNTRIPDARVVAHGTFAALLVLLVATTTAHALGVLGSLLASSGTVRGSVLSLSIWVLCLLAARRVAEEGWAGPGQLERSAAHGAATGMWVFALLFLLPLLITIGNVLAAGREPLRLFAELWGTLPGSAILILLGLAIAAFIGTAVACLVLFVDLRLRGMADRWVPRVELEGEAEG